jgi:hypothetical protein
MLFAVRKRSTPETFSSELAGLQERGNRPPSFNQEFRGLSDSQIVITERPPRERGKLGPLGMGVAVVLGVALGVAMVAAGAYFGLDYLEHRGEAEADEAVPEIEAEVPVPKVEPEPPVDPWAETPPLKYDGEALPWPPPNWDGQTPPPADPTPTPTPDITPTPTPTPAPTPTPSPTPSAGKPSAVLIDGSIRGKISSLSARLGAIDQAVATCWTTAVQQGDRGEHTLALSFTIRWNRKATGVAASGDGLSTTMRSCVEQAVPRSGWPEPRDLGEAKVSRRWTLKSE